MVGLISAVLLAQVEIVTPSQVPGIGPPGLLDPAPPPQLPAGGVASDGGLDGLRARAAETAAAAAEAARALAAAEAPSRGWGGSANVSVISFTGNTNAITLSTTLLVTKIFKDGWIAALRAGANYGDARVAPGSPVQLTALSAGGQRRGDRVVARSATVYLLGGLDTDHVDSLELREYAEPGMAVFWLDCREGDLERLLLRTDLGLRYAHERRFQYYPSELDLGEVQFLGPRFGLAFHIAASKEVSFLQEGELLRDFTSNRLVVNTGTKIMARLVKQFSLTASFLVAYDSSPPLNRLTTDTSLTAGVELKF